MFSVNNLKVILILKLYFNIIDEERFTAPIDETILQSTVNPVYNEILFLMEHFYGRNAMQ